MTTTGPEQAVQPGRTDLLLARDVMTAPVIMVSLRDSVRTLLQEMQRCGVRHLVVVDDGRCAGVVDDRRVVLEWALGPHGGTGRTAGELLPHEVRCVLPGTPVQAVAQLLIEDSRGAVPVVSAEGQVVGIVTARDLLRCLLEPSAS